MDIFTNPIIIIAGLIWGVGFICEFTSIILCRFDKVRAQKKFHNIYNVLKFCTKLFLAVTMVLLFFVNAIKKPEIILVLIIVVALIAAVYILIEKILKKK